VAAAVAAWPAWASRPASERAAVLFGAAAWMRERRGLLGALEVIEAGKPWAEADADVCEAIDFCEYYGREAIRLDGGGAVQSPPGERNDLRYHGKGVAAGEAVSAVASVMTSAYTGIVGLAAYGSVCQPRLSRRALGAPRSSVPFE